MRIEIKSETEIKRRVNKKPLQRMRPFTRLQNTLTHFVAINSPFIEKETTHPHIGVFICSNKFKPMMNLEQIEELLKMVQIKKFDLDKKAPQDCQRFVVDPQLKYGYYASGHKEAARAIMDVINASIGREPNN